MSYNSEPQGFPLRPRPLSRRSHDSGGSSGGAQPPPFPTKKRRAIVAACETCRRRKAKCDGQRPRCTACASRNLDCEYVTGEDETHPQALKRKYGELQGQNEAHRRVYDLLQSKPPSEAAGIFRRICTGATADAILRQVTDGDLLLQLSLEPETRLRYRLPYSEDLSRISARSPGNGYLRSQIYEWSSREMLLGDDPTSGSASAHAPIDDDDQKLNDHQRPYLMPYHSATIVDPRIQEAQLSKWTSVSDDDELMRELLASYFLYEHHGYNFFHKDYFLDDMLQGRRRFCSRLLVNCILAHAWHSYQKAPRRAEYWDPQSLGYRFLAEARRLWELKVHTPRLTTIHSALLLNLTYNLNGLDKIGWTFSVQGFSMAHDLRLFDAPDTASYNTMSARSRMIQDARDFTAWSLFAWQSLYCYHLAIPLMLKEPPPVELPDPTIRLEWYGEVWLRYPLAQQTVPTHQGLFFKAMVGLRIILFDVTLESRGLSGTQAKLSLSQALHYRQRMMDWYEDLPVPLQAENIVFPSHLKLHLHYHLLLMEFFEPLTAEEVDHPLRVSGLLSVTPQRIVCDARGSLEILLRLYYLRHGFDHLDSFMMHFFAAIGFRSLGYLKTGSNADNDSITRSTLVLAAKGFHDQSKSMWLAHTTLQVLSKEADAADWDLIQRYAGVEVDHNSRPLKASEIQSLWPIKIQMEGDEDEEEKTLGDIVRKYYSDNLSDASASPEP